MLVAQSTIMPLKMPTQAMAMTKETGYKFSRLMPPFAGTNSWSGPTPSCSKWTGVSVRHLVSIENLQSPRAHRNLAGDLLAFAVLGSLDDEGARLGEGFVLRAPALWLHTAHIRHRVIQRQVDREHDDPPDNTHAVSSSSFARKD